MLSELRPALVILGLSTVLLGGIYPLAVTGVARAAMPSQASGSITHAATGHESGSALIGQPFADPKYFWGRLSATLDANSKPLPYNAASSLGSNLGPTNPALTDMAKARIDALRAADPGDTRLVPVDLVTASGSGLDPHISPAAAEFQVRRVARVRALPEDKVRALVQASTEQRTLGVLGEARVNVLALNAALDAP
jgi:K+-transporting ATPase ATPase C chain